MTIPPALIQEKNKLSGDGAWVVLLELSISGEDVIRLANNNEDVTWDGYTWQKFSFELDTIKEDGQGGLPSFTVKISNITREFTSLIDGHDGATDSEVIIRVVNSEILTETEPLFVDISRVISTSIQLDWIVFTLGAQNPMQMLSPRERYLANHCRYKEFKGTKCGYAGVDGTCDRTFSDCSTKGNSMRFGGFPAITQGNGVYL